MRISDLNQNVCVAKMAVTREQYRDTRFVGNVTLDQLTLAHARPSELPQLGGTGGITDHSIHTLASIKQLTNEFKSDTSACAYNDPYG